MLLAHAERKDKAKKQLIATPALAERLASAL